MADKAVKPTGKKLRLRILTPYREIYNRDVDYVILRSSEGDAGIQPGHEPYTTILGEGILVYHRHSQIRTFVVLGGYASALDDEVTVISEIADHPDKIKQTINELAMERAKFEKDEREGGIDIQQIELGLRRALVHVDVSAYSILKGRGSQVEFDDEARLNDDDDDESGQ
jgi:F-type H+-transporting ATPase subunit epsilon